MSEQQFPPPTQQTPQTHYVPPKPTTEDQRYVPAEQVTFPPQGDYSQQGAGQSQFQQHTQQPAQQPSQHSQQSPLAQDPVSQVGLDAVYPTPPPEVQQAPLAQQYPQQTYGAPPLGQPYQQSDMQFSAQQGYQQPPQYGGQPPAQQPTVQQPYQQQSYDQQPPAQPGYQPSQPIEQQPYQHAQPSAPAQPGQVPAPGQPPLPPQQQGYQQNPTFGQQQNTPLYQPQQYPQQQMQPQHYQQYPPQYQQTPYNQQWQQGAGQKSLVNRFALYLTLGIIEIVLCAWPFAVAAIVYAVMMNAAYKQGNMALFVKKRKMSRIWLIVSLVVALLLYTLYFFLFAATGSAGVY